MKTADAHPEFKGVENDFVAFDGEVGSAGFIDMPPEVALASGRG